MTTENVTATATIARDLRNPRGQLICQIGFSKTCTAIRKIGGARRNRIGFSSPNFIGEFAEMTGEVMKTKSKPLAISACENENQNYRLHRKVETIHSNESQPQMPAGAIRGHENL